MNRRVGNALLLATSVTLGCSSGNDPASDVIGKGGASSEATSYSSGGLSNYGGATQASGGALPSAGTGGKLTTLTSQSTSGGMHQASGGSNAASNTLGTLVGGATHQGTTIANRGGSSSVGGATPRGGNSSSGGSLSAGGSAKGGASSGPSEVPNNTQCAPVSTWDNANTAIEEQILVIVNQRRASGASCGGVNKPAVGALTMDPYLRCAARLHDHDMVTRDYFSHGTYDTSAPTCTEGNNAPCEDAGYDGCYEFDDVFRCAEGMTSRMLAVGASLGRTWAENITMGNTTASGIMQSWMNSAGHCNNIMNGDFKRIGIAYESSIATQVFGG